MAAPRLACSVHSVLPVLAPLAGFALVTDARPAVKPVSADHPASQGTGGDAPRAAAACFDLASARELVEFAVDLDAQDDRNTKGGTADGGALYLPRYGDRWQMLVDTRQQHSDGTARNRASDPSWNPDDPNRNGFGPFANAWILARRKDPLPPGLPASLPTYVVAIRGTVFSDRPSVLEDVFANTITARHVVKLGSGMTVPLEFAQLPGAEVHAGFGYACLSLLFNQKFGLSCALQGIAEEQVRIILTGHSQGAAMATLLHAFVHYANRGGWLLGGKILHLRSCVFAQPKPGNALLAADFDRLTLGGSACFTVNNSLDPVPEVPLTRQSLSDLSGDLPSGSRIDWFVNAIGRPSQLLRHWFSSKMDRQIAQMMGSEDLVLGPPGVASCRAKRCQFPAGTSLNYTLAGTLVPLVGDPAAAYPGQDPGDPFIQHHSPTYRELLCRL